MEGDPGRIRRILCPTDFSEHSARALRHAASLGRRLDAQLTLLHVIPFAASPGTGLAPFPLPALPLVASPPLREQAERQLFRLAAPLLDAGHAVGLELREGEPWREIDAAARTLRADLVVMGSHGYGALERLLLGSVAERVLRSAACPVLTLSHEREPADAGWSRILCALDLGPGSAHTLAFAAALATRARARLTLLHVLEGLQPPDPAAGAAAFHAAERFVRDSRQWAAQRLQRAADGAANQACDVVAHVVLGQPGRRILEIAEEQASDLIVVGRNTHGLLGTPLFGSNSLRVVRGAGCPVATVPAPGLSESARSAPAPRARL